MSDSEPPSVLDVSSIHGVSVRFALRTGHHRKFFGRYMDGTLHEPALTEHIVDFLSPGDTFIDVGAHLGWFSVLAAARGARVFAFEMQTGLIPLIHESLVLNDCADRVDVIGAGLGSSCGIVPYRRQSLSASKGVSTDIDDEVRYAPLLTMDAALAGVQPKLIKIDVQGFEGHVIEGAKETLVRSRAAVVVELHEATTQYGSSIAQVLTALSDLGYTIEMYSSHRSDARGRSRISPEQFGLVRDDSLIFAEMRA